MTVVGIEKFVPSLWQWATGSLPQTACLQFTGTIGCEYWVLSHHLGHNRDLTWGFNPGLIFSIIIFILYLKTALSSYSALCYTDLIFLFPFVERAVHQVQRAAWITYLSFVWLLGWFPAFGFDFLLLINNPGLDHFFTYLQLYKWLFIHLSYSFLTT